MSHLIEAKPWSDFTECLTIREFTTIDRELLDDFSLLMAGETPQLGCSRLMLMVSRLPRYLTADQPWLKSVTACLQDANQTGATVVSSLGGTGWDFVTCQAAAQGCRIWVVLPPARSTELLKDLTSLRVYYGLEASPVTFFLPLTSHRMAKRAQLHFRDELVFNLSHQQFPICLRKGSFWEELCLNQHSVKDQFQTVYPRRTKPDWNQSLDLTRIKTQLLPDNYLTHWTRGSLGPWKGETAADYYRALVRSRTGNPRDGLATLIQIVNSGILRGEGKMVKGSTPAISFTGLPPSEALNLVCYRPALMHYNFEPFGIALPRTLIQQLGARPVIYGSEQDYLNLSEELKPYYQRSNSRASSKGGPDLTQNWTSEREWRLLGDLDLASLADQIVLLVPDETQAEIVRQETGVRTLALMSET